MKIDVSMPRLSDSMTEGAVTAWFRRVGDTVAEGEAIAELETEKSTVDLAAPAAGVLLRILVEAGSGAVAVGTVLAQIETDATAVAPSPAAPTPPAKPDAEAAPVSRADSSRVPASPSPATTTTTAPADAATPVAADDAAIPATPLARRMAAQAGLSLASLGRSGIGGKVSKADVEAALGRVAIVPAAPPAASPAAAARASATGPAALAAPLPAGVPQPLSRVRRTVAERMAKAKATIPHFYLSVDCRVDRLLAVRETLKADGLAVSVNDFVVRAAALALRRVPAANASWTDAGIVRHERVDIAVAVALDDGLVTPVVRAVDTLGLEGIGAAVRDLASRARDGRLAPHEYDGGTFTVSNLGMHGIGAMFAIVNPPQACILGVGAADPRPVVEDGAVVAGTVMTLSLSADHRVLDGATGARLLAEIRRLLEEPARMLA